MILRRVTSSLQTRKGRRKAVYLCAESWHRQRRIFIKRDADELARANKTKAWFSSYKGLLTERSTYRRQMKGAPYFGVYNVGEYTFMPWKVVWPEMSSRFYAAVVGDAEVPVAGMRPYVPDHKVYYSAFERKEEAFYLCGLLNTPMVAEWIESHTVNIRSGISLSILICLNLKLGIRITFARQL